MDIIPEVEQQSQTFEDQIRQHKQQEALNNAPLHSKPEQELKVAPVAKPTTKKTAIMQYYDEFLSSNAFIVGGKKNFILGEHTGDDGFTHFSYAMITSKKEEWTDRIESVVLDTSSGQKVKRMEVVDIMLRGTPIIAAAGYARKPAKRWQGVAFKPNQTTDVSFNLYRENPLVPIKGDTKPFYDHFLSVVTRDELDVILDFFAHLHQKPEEKPKWALVLQGSGKGTGKNTIIEMLGSDLLNRDYSHQTSDPKKSFGQFNAHLETNLLMILDEITGDVNKHDAQIKGMITESEWAIEPKGMDQRMMTNYSRVVLTGNPDQLIKAEGTTERRYGVILFPDKNNPICSVIKGTPNYWKTFYNWYKSGGGKEALYYEMLHRDLSRFDFTVAPKTKGLATQLGHSLDPVERFILAALEAGYFGRVNLHNQERPNSLGRIRSSRLYESFIRSHPYANITNTMFSKKLRVLLPVSMIKSNGNFFVFPPLEECVDHFIEETGVETINAEDDWNNESVIGAEK